MTSPLFVNLSNLEKLWEIQPSLTVSLDKAAIGMLCRWPNRLWQKPLGLAPDLVALNAHASPSHVIVLPSVTEEEAKAAGFEVLFTQTVMCRSLHSILPSNSKVLLRTVEASAAALWAKVTGHCFGYEVEPDSVAALCGSSANLYFVVVDGHIAGTVMTLQEGQVAGIHQVGIVPEFRGQGLARAVMQKIENQLATQGVTEYMLQASKMGEPLYLSLGYEALGQITNVRKRI